MASQSSEISLVCFYKQSELKAKLGSLSDPYKYLYMKAREFINEAAVGSIRIGDIVIVVDDHAIEQVYMREIDPRAVDGVFRKLPAVRDELESMDSGSKIWIRDSASGVSVGLRKISADQMRFQFKTAVQNRTYQSDTPEIEIPEQLDELTFLGSECTYDCSGHRAGYAWYQRNQRDPLSWSPSFNKGAALAKAGK
jgi:hypothetical protein